jgi:DNA repair protein RadC
MEAKKRDSKKMYEVGIVYKRPLFDTMPVIRNSGDAHTVLSKLIDYDLVDYKEYFWVLLLTKSNRVLGFSQIGMGDTASVVVNIKEIFQLALKANACGLILCHNHPSGNLTSSKPDKTLTEKIKIAGNIFSIQLVDHIIITREGFYSLADNGDILVPDNTLPF